MHCFMSDYMNSSYIVLKEASAVPYVIVSSRAWKTRKRFLRRHTSTVKESSLHDNSVFICKYLRCWFSLRNKSWGDLCNTQSKQTWLHKQMFSDAVPVFSVKPCFVFVLSVVFNVWGTLLWNVCRMVSMCFCLTWADLSVRHELRLLLFETLYFTMF